MQVVGIDWATTPMNRALVRLSASDAGVLVMTVEDRVSDARVRETCVDPAIRAVAIDAPFGWPKAFSRFVCEWALTASGGGRPPSSDLFRFRHTDRIVRDEVPKQPLSVSADRIALGTRAWLDCVSDVGLHRRIDVVGEDDSSPPSIIEVYPGATAVQLWAGNRLGSAEREASYKSDGAARRRLVEHVGRVFAVDFGMWLDQIVSTGEDSDQTDAFMAAITALIHAHTVGSGAGIGGWKARCPRSAEEREDALREGWIFFPVRSTTE